MVPILVEPAYSNSVWCVSLLEGLTGEFKQKRIPFCRRVAMRGKISFGMVLSGRINVLSISVTISLSMESSFLTICLITREAICGVDNPINTWPIKNDCN